MEVEKVNIWLDCDVGNDDAMAIIMALFHPKSNLLGISTCFGNTCLENCTNNTIRLLSSVGRSDVQCSQIRISQKGLEHITRQVYNNQFINFLTGICSKRWQTQVAIPLIMPFLMVFCNLFKVTQGSEFKNALSKSRTQIQEYLV